MNLIRKAQKLSLYNQFIIADANKPLPFDNDNCQTIFSNIIYWLDNPIQTFTNNSVLEIEECITHLSKTLIQI